MPSGFSPSSAQHWFIAHREGAAKVLLLDQEVHTRTERYLETAHGYARLRARYDWDTVVLDATTLRMVRPRATFAAQRWGGASRMTMGGSIFCGGFARIWNLWSPAFEQASRSQFEVLQVKEKFGGLRISVNHANDAIRRRLEAAQQESFHTCEVCGQSGELREDDWIKTLCEEHTSEERNDG